MNPILHQWKWDFRRIRTTWIVWLALLVLSTALRHLALGAVIHRSPLIPPAAMAEVIVIYVLGALLVAFAMFTTPFTGSSAFWKTRPLPSTALFWQKTLLVLALVWLPVLLSRTILYLLIDPAPSILANPALTELPLTLATYLFAALLAALCADARSLILAIAGSIGSMMLLGMLGAFLHRGRSQAFLQIGNSTSTWQTMVTGLLLLATLLLLAWFLAGLRKHRTAAIVTAAIALVAFASQNSIWTIGLGNGPHLPKTNIDLVALQHDKIPAPSFSTLYPQLAAQLPEDQIFAPAELDLSFIRNRDQQQLYAGSPGESSTTIARQLHRLYPAGTRLLTSESHYSRDLINNSQVAPDPGTFSGSSSGIVFRFERLGSMPATSRRPRSFRGFGIVRIGAPDPRHDDFEVPVSSVCRNRNFSHRYLPISMNPNLTAILRHTKTGTLIAPDFGGSSSGGGFNLITRSDDFRFSQKALHTALGRPPVPEDLDEFEFDFYRLTPVASATGTFRQENWVPFTGPSDDPEAPAKPDDSWTRAVLPDNPTDDQVDAYLDTLLFDRPTSARGSNHRTLQAKLNALGAAHLDHLIARLPAYHDIQSLIHNTIRHHLTRDHLPALLDAFQRDPSMAGMLLQKQWAEDGVAIAREHLRSQSPFSSTDTTALITIATTTPDPSLNDHLLRHFVLADQGHIRMIGQLRQHPGFPLDDAIAQAWARKRAGLIDSPDLAYLTVRLGDHEALRQALAHFSSLSNTKDRRYRTQRDLLDAGLDQPAGTDPVTWARTHFGNLHFDPEHKVFLLPE